MRVSCSKQKTPALINCHLNVNWVNAMHMNQRTTLNRKANQT
jgi:hypothetical protein